MLFLQMFSQHKQNHKAVRVNGMKRKMQAEKVPSAGTDMAPEGVDGKVREI